MSKIEKDIKPLIVRIEGTRITAQKFLQVAINFFGLLRKVADDISGKEDSVTWLVTAEKGSQVLKAFPEVNESNIKEVRTITRMIYNGCRQIEKKGDRPNTFSDTALWHIKEMAKAIGNGDGDVSKITLSYKRQSNIISNKTTLHVGEILLSKRTEEGSVEGRVTVLSDKKRLNVFVDDILTGHSVKCIPRNIDEETLIGAFRRRIVAIGTVHYRRDGAPVKIDVDKIHVLGKREELPTFEDVKGIFRQGS